MTAPVIPSGGQTTVNRKWVLEVNVNTVAAPDWEVLEFVSNFDPTFDDANWEDSTSYGDGGYNSQNKTAAGWSANATVMRKTLVGAPTAYPPVQEYLRLKAIGKFGPTNQVQIRVFEYDTSDAAGIASPRVEAYMGFVGVQWAQQGGPHSGNSEVQITLNAQSKLSIIAHPYPATPAVPVIDSASPLALLAAGGQLVHIYGRGFTGTVTTTGVKFAGTNAPSWSVESDSLIIAVTPAHTAGSGAIVVTNATGASTTGPTVTYS